MYVHNENWVDALSVAEKHDPKNIGQVLIGQAKVQFEKKEYTKSESLLLRAQRPDMALNLYKEAGMWNEAVKFARGMICMILIGLLEYLPAKLAEIQDEQERFASNKSANGKDEIMATARNLEVWVLRMIFN